MILCPGFQYGDAVKKTYLTSCQRLELMQLEFGRAFPAEKTKTTTVQIPSPDAEKAKTKLENSWKNVPWTIAMGRYFGFI